MKFKTILTLFILFFSFSLLSVQQSYSQGNTVDLFESDHTKDVIVYFFDLRDRETFIQVTNTDSSGHLIHIQIFDVGNLCNENDFFDNYTGNDTHVYNLRDIITNDGNSPGVILPDGAYGILAATVIDPSDGSIDASANVLMGNLRIIDDNGYEYRTNAQGEPDVDADDAFATFNFNTIGNVTLSDVVGVVFNDVDSEGGIVAADPTEDFAGFDIDIFDLNENPFSCRNVIFACINQDSPRLEELLETANDDNINANVADFEYGINEAIPHSKGGELLCPSNTISEGFVRLGILFSNSGESFDDIIVFVGLNNGNGRGSMDGYWAQSNEVSFGGGPG